ncbi:Hypothetical Protein FCC1311_078222 [Hondaea fermentalgiana]|uniref:Uncharacterized protein n=1 Tax=Hondaea fermentalgiana TaxID=2315210 RepID=A0A2R5GL36_9STRA|nr:Hypothetical Protein FCC1311_078222 [Hondaea fermentalgiana]|eukprot:GBG31597.1 Hypothetical Protein FCC1311_078222 [Hondaea fermentalgiana]
MLRSSSRPSLRQPPSPTLRARVRSPRFLASLFALAQGAVAAFSLAKSRSELELELERSHPCGCPSVHTLFLRPVYRLPPSEHAATDHGQASQGQRGGTAGSGHQQLSLALSLWAAATAVETFGACTREGHRGGDSDSDSGTGASLDL